MKKAYIRFSSLIILAIALLVNGSRVYAYDTSRYVSQIQPEPSVEQLESQFHAQLTTRQEPYGQPKATSYYDDLDDHCEQGQLMRDVIDEGIS